MYFFYVMYIEICVNVFSFVLVVVKEFETKYGVDISADDVAVARLRGASERLKRQLSFLPEFRLAIDQLHARLTPNAIDFDTFLTRDHFENLNMDIFNAALNVVQNALSKAGMEKHDVHKILLVGEFLVLVAIPY